MIRRITHRYAFPLLLLILFGQQAACAWSTSTLPSFPEGVKGGEVEPALPEVKEAFAEAYPEAKLLRLAAGTRTWTVQDYSVERAQYNSGQASSVEQRIHRRVAYVHVAYEAEGKCYYQYWLIQQPFQGTNWGLVRLVSADFYEDLTAERSREYGLRYLIDCGKVNAGDVVPSAAPSDAADAGNGKSASSAPPGDTKEAAPQPQAESGATPPAGPSPSSGSDAGDIEAIIARLDPKAPAECQSFVRTACHHPKFPEATRAKICATYVDSVQKLVAQASTNAADGCNTLMKSLPK